MDTHLHSVMPNKHMHNLALEAQEHVSEFPKTDGQPSGPEKIASQLLKLALYGQPESGGYLGIPLQGKIDCLGVHPGSWLEQHVLAQQIEIVAHGLC